MTKTVKAIVGGTLILPCIPKVIYSFPANIALSEWYVIDAYDAGYVYFTIGEVKLFPDRLDRPEAADEVRRFLVKHGVYDKYTSWHFYKVDTPPGVSEGFIWSGSSTVRTTTLHQSREGYMPNPIFDKQYLLPTFETR